MPYVTYRHEQIQSWRFDAERQLFSIGIEAQTSITGRQVNIRGYCSQSADLCRLLDKHRTLLRHATSSLTAGTMLDAAQGEVGADGAAGEGSSRSGSGSSASGSSSTSSSMSSVASLKDIAVAVNP